MAAWAGEAGWSPCAAASVDPMANRARALDRAVSGRNEASAVMGTPWSALQPLPGGRARRGAGGGRGERKEGGRLGRASGDGAAGQADVRGRRWQGDDGGGEDDGIAGGGLVVFYRRVGGSGSRRVSSEPLSRELHA